MRRGPKHVTNRVATIADYGIRVAALMWLLPALLINLDWSATASTAWNLAASGSIVASAMFVEAAIRAGSWVRSTTFAAGALILIFANLQTAFDNAAHRSSDRSDHRQAQMQAAAHASSQRQQWSLEREQAIKVAGLVPRATIEADIQRAMTEHAGRWRSTRSCDPVETTAPASIAFCVQLATLRGQLAAADHRDRLSARIQELDIAAAVNTIPASADAFADGATALLTAFGISLAGDARLVLSPLKDLIRSLALELVAALGPSAWLLMLSRVRYRMPTRRQRVVGAPRARSQVTTNPALRHAADAFDKFMSIQLEAAAGSSLRAGAAWMAWQAWCAKERLDPGTQKRFGARMKMHFEHERNNNRPRYLNVTLRARAGKPPAVVNSQQREAR